MVKIDKSKYTKAEWKELKEKRRLEKTQKRLKNIPPEQPNPHLTQDNSRYLHGQPNAFVLGNGTSRSFLEPNSIKPYGPIYGCNALYRTFDPDYLVCVDAKMILEINKAGYQNKNPQVWTNPNRAYTKMKNLNLFSPSKGWSSGPTALWLASQHGHQRIYILGFDYRGLEDGKKFNNMYADSYNYKKSSDGATFFGNWLRQTVSVVQQHKNIQYFRVIQPDNYCPEELNKFDNFKNIYVDEFQKMFSLS